MYKIYVDSRQRKITRVTLFKKNWMFWFKKDILELEADPADAISKILVKNGLEAGKISFFEAFPGPGSYTGLKMGFASVNVLKWVFEKTPALKLPLPKYGSEPNITPPENRK